MKKILQCAGTVVYSTVAGYLLWLLFYWMTPYVMGMGWLMLFAYIFIAAGLITAIALAANTALAFPMVFLMRDNKAARVINVFPFLLYGFSAVRLPWGLDMEYGFLQYILGISLTITILISFGSLISLPFKFDEFE